MTKTMVIFDFDYSMIDCDSLYEQVRIGLSEEDMKEIEKVDIEKSFEYSIGLAYKKFKSKGKTVQDINSYIDTIKLGKGMKELLEYLHNSNKYDLIIVSGDIDYPIKRILKNEGVLEYFSAIYGIPSETDEVELIKLTPLIKTGCKNCEPNGCKTYFFNEYLKKQGKEKFNNFYFVCDGFNDYCLGENLGVKDVLFPRKDYKLYKRLYEKGDLKNLKCKCVVWENGNDILNTIKNDLKD